MKLSVDQKLLARAVATVTRAVERRNIIPILQNVLLTAENGTLTVTGTDMDTEVSITIDGDVADPGATTISANAFSSLSMRIPPNPKGIIRLALLKTEKLLISTDRSKFELFTQPAINYPVMQPPEKDKWTLKLTGTELTTLFSQVEHCIAKDDSRWFLNGIHLTIEDVETSDPQLVAVATNGHHLAKTSISAPKGALATKTRTIMPGIILPEKTIRLLTHVLANKDGALQLVVSTEKIEVTSETHRITSKLIDGEFPDYHRVIPDSSPNPVLVDTNVTLSAVDFVKSAAEDPKNALAISLTKGAMTIEVSNDKVGDARDELAIDYAGDDLRIGLAAEYLSANLAKCGSEFAKIHFGENRSPVKIIPQTDRPTTLVIMPARI